MEDFFTNISNIKLNDIEAIINKDLEKKKLVALGVNRFGISKSKLNGLNKAKIIETIKAAINNERIISVIEKEARIAAFNRKS